MSKKLSDLNFTNRLHKAVNFLFENVTPTPLNDPALLHYNEDLLNILEISPTELSKTSTLNFFNGNLEFDGIINGSTYYAGHQFGYFVPRLGDGRAIMLGEIQNSQNQFFELQLKGSGLTPFSRMGDGKAVIRSSIREYLASAHLKALNIKTTEALAIVTGSDPVRREEIESAAIVLRVCESFLRFGHFEFLYFHGHHEELKQLVDTAIKNYFSEFYNHPNQYYLFYQEVVKRTAKLMAAWQSVGFCHGVMNTDNMSLLGYTIDYGPYGFLERFDLDHICNHSDHEGRYSFGNQPPIAKWNLEKLGIALTPVLSAEQQRKVLETYETIFNVEYQRLLRLKLGLSTIEVTDEELIRQMLKMLYESKIDYTNFFRQLCYYKIGDRVEGIPEMLASFLDRYDERLKRENSIDTIRIEKLKSINPKFILRNYLAQMVIDDPNLIGDMYKVLTQPFLEWDEFHAWSEPTSTKYQFICVSCSS